MSDDFNLPAYLDRIGYHGSVKADLVTLTALHAAHVDKIPFEGMDPFLRRPVDIGLGSIQQKLVNSRRGGYCFEQNTLFKAALEAIGFSVTGLGGRVRWMSQPGSPLGPREHMILSIDLPEGAFIADVGFGACLLDRPLPLHGDSEHMTAMGTFRLTENDGMFSLSARQPVGWRKAYVFNLEPQISSDFELGNWYTSTSPRVPFQRTLIIERLANDRRYKLINNRFLVETRDGEICSERIISSAIDFALILDEIFYITPPIPAEQIFSRF